MAAIHETAYPRIKPIFTQKELIEIFKPNDTELLLLDAKTKKTSNVSRLGFMLFLKYYQYLGQPVKIKHIDDSIKQYVAEQLNISSQINLKKYSQATRTRHMKIIREYLNINSDKQARRRLMKATALQAATIKENLADIINRIIEELFRERYELPAYKSLVRLSRAARTVTNRNYYSTIANALTKEQKQLIDSILGIEMDPAINKDENLSWLMLKQESKAPTSNNVKDFINYVNQLKSLRQKINIDLSFIPPARLEHLRDEAMVTDRSDMQKIAPLKRYALVVILVYMKAASGIDDLVQIFILWMRKIETKSKNSLEEYRLKQAEKTDEYILLLYNMLLAVKNNTSAVLPAAHQSWKEKKSAIVEPTTALTPGQEKKKRIQEAVIYVYFESIRVKVDYAAWLCLINTLSKDLSTLENIPTTPKTLMTRSELEKLRSLHDKNKDLFMLIAFCKKVAEKEGIEGLSILLKDISQTPEGLEFKKNLIVLLPSDLQARLSSSSPSSSPIAAAGAAASTSSSLVSSLASVSGAYSSSSSSFSSSSPSK
jgi:hypothetical protein